MRRIQSIGQKLAVCLARAKVSPCLVIDRRPDAEFDGCLAGRHEEVHRDSIVVSKIVLVTAGLTHRRTWLSVAQISFGPCIMKRATMTMIESS